MPPDGRVLDFGCADRSYRRFFAASVDYVGALLPGNALASVEIGPDGTVPVEDASIDAVLSTRVLEQVTDPAVYLRECFRVLRPGGRLLLSTHGFMVYQPDPVDRSRRPAALDGGGPAAGGRRRRLRGPPLRGIMGLGAPAPSRPRAAGRTRSSSPWWRAGRER